MTYHQFTRKCDGNCDWCDCDESVRLPDDEETREPPEFGCCLPPGECCMPGLHFPSECHTAADYERAQFGGLASDAGPRKTPNGPVERAALGPSARTGG